MRQLSQLLLAVLRNSREYKSIIHGGLIRQFKYLSGALVYSKPLDQLFEVIDLAIGSQKRQ
jgi:hypothetical protein